MQSAIAVKKLGALALLLSLFSAIGVSAAFAADIPTLLWERGRQQTITFGEEGKENSWTIALVGPGKTQTFRKSTANPDGYFVYSVDIPRNQKIGDYKVLVSGNDRQDEVVAYVNLSKSISYNLLSDPEALGLLAVVFTTLVSAFLSGNSSLGGSQGFEEGNPDDPYQGDENTSTVESVGSELLEVSESRKGAFDQFRLGRISLVASLDATRHSWVQALAPRSRAWMRVVADASWLQAILGPVALLTPILGAVLGFAIFASHDFSQTVIPSANPLLVTLIALGVFDALAGALGGAIFLISVIVSGNMNSTADIRGLLGVTVLFFLPILISGTIRPLRRIKNSSYSWERAADYLIAPVFGFWAVKSLITAVDGFAQQLTELSQSASSIAIITSALIAVRLLCEDVAQKLAPARIEYLASPYLKNMDSYSQLVSISIKTCIYIFFMYGFLQYSWQGFVAIAFLIVPQVIKIYLDKLPNFPLLFQIIPGGVPGIVFTAILGLTVSNWVNTLPLVTEDKSRTIFILVGIPGFILSLLKILGRSPKKGDVRWYRREKYIFLYRSAGIIMYALALSLVSGVLL